MQDYATVSCNTNLLQDWCNASLYYCQLTSVKLHSGEALSVKKGPSFRGGRDYTSTLSLVFSFFNLYWIILEGHFSML
jgi:hypothetical protein